MHDCPSLELDSFYFLNLQNNYLQKSLKYSIKFKVQIVRITALLSFPEQGLGIFFFTYKYGKLFKYRKLNRRSKYIIS